jgi:hypothetical protein
MEILLPVSCFVIRHEEAKPQTAINRVRGSVLQSLPIIICYVRLIDAVRFDREFSNHEATPEYASLYFKLINLSFQRAISLRGSDNNMRTRTLSLGRKSRPSLHVTFDSMIRDSEPVPETSCSTTGRSSGRVSNAFLYERVTRGDSFVRDSSTRGRRVLSFAIDDEEESVVPLLVSGFA